MSILFLVIYFSNNLNKPFFLSDFFVVFNNLKAFLFDVKSIIIVFNNKKKYGKNESCNVL